MFLPKKLLDSRKFEMTLFDVRPVNGFEGCVPKKSLWTANTCCITSKEKSANSSWDNRRTGIELMIDMAASQGINAKKYTRETYPVQIHFSAAHFFAGACGPCAFLFKLMYFDVSDAC